MGGPQGAPLREGEAIKHFPGVGARVRALAARNMRSADGEQR